jgi:hypothetical protein
MHAENLKSKDELLAEIEELGVEMKSIQKSKVEFNREVNKRQQVSSSKVCHPSIDLHSVPISVARVCGD